MLSDFPSFANICFDNMLAVTFVTVLFVQTALVYGAAADSEAGSSVAENAPYKTRLSEETFEWLKTVTLVRMPIGLEERDFRAITQGQDHRHAQQALGAWATIINESIDWDERHCAVTRIAKTDIVRSQKDIDEQLGSVIVWKDMTLVRHTNSISHLIIRQISSDIYEWLEVCAPAMDAMGRAVDYLDLFPVESTNLLIQWKFAADESDGRRLTEICSVFAEQQIQTWHSGVGDAVQSLLKLYVGDKFSDHDLHTLSNLEDCEQRLYMTFEDLLGIGAREREKLENTVRDLEGEKAHSDEIKKQWEEQLQNAEAERSRMSAHLEASRIREENSESRRAEMQRQLDECQRAEKETNHWIMMAALIGGAVMLLMIGIIIFLLCRRAGRGIIQTSEDMRRGLGMKRDRPLGEHSLPNRQPGSVAINVAEIDPQFRCSRDPQVAAFRHSILADENAQFGINQIEEVTEQEGIDISAVTRQSTIENAEEDELLKQSMQEGVKGAVERKQRRQMCVEPLKEMVQNAVAIQEEVMDEIVEVMETDKSPDPESTVG